MRSLAGQLAFDFSAHTKQCSKCGEVKARDDFQRHTRSKDGLQCWCKMCRSAHDERTADARRAYKRAYYDAHKAEILSKTTLWATTHPEKVRQVKRAWYERNRTESSRHYEARLAEMARTGAKICTGCGKTKRAAEFHRASVGALRRQPKCRECERAYVEKRIEHVAHRQRRWRLENPATKKAASNAYRRRQLAAEGQHTADDIAHIYAAQSGLCYYCGGALDNRFHVDHKQPLSRGGTDNADNLACTCARCNLRKRARTESEFRAMLARTPQAMR